MEIKNSSILIRINNFNIIFLLIYKIIEKNKQIKLNFKKMLKNIWILKAKIVEF